MQRHQETVFDKRGNVISGCEITVKTLDGTLASLYSGNSTATPIANPVITDSDGQAHFYAANGHYNITTHLRGNLVDQMNDVVLFDPDDLAGLDDVDVMVFSAEDVELFNGIVGIKRPPASNIPATNGEMSFELTSNTELKIRVRGSDGVVRSASLTLA